MFPKSPACQISSTSARNLRNGASKVPCVSESSPIRFTVVLLRPASASLAKEQKQGQTGLPANNFSSRPIVRAREGDRRINQKFPIFVKVNKILCRATFRWQKDYAPARLDEYIGQEHLVGPQGVFRKFIETGNVPSFILWGPPGVGKTTLAKLVATALERKLFTLSAVTSGVKEVREVIEQARKSQFLQYALRRSCSSTKSTVSTSRSRIRCSAPSNRVSITLIGATTENPSFEVISPLLSRCQVYVLKAMEDGRPATAARTRRHYRPDPPRTGRRGTTRPGRCSVSAGATPASCSTFSTFSATLPTERSSSATRTSPTACNKTSRSTTRTANSTTT